MEAAYVRKMFDYALNKKVFKDLIEEMKAVGIKGKRGKEYNNMDKLGMDLPADVVKYIGEKLSTLKKGISSESKLIPRILGGDTQI